MRLQTEPSVRTGNPQHLCGKVSHVGEHEDAVRATGRVSDRRDKQAEEARQRHISAVLAALKAGERPTDVASWSRFTATYVRKLARDAGMPPAPPGRKSQRGHQNSS